MTRPCRRITLHLSLIFLTLGLTFISLFLRRRTHARANPGLRQQLFRVVDS